MAGVASLMLSSVLHASPSDDFAEGLRLFSNKEFASAAKALESSYKGDPAQRTLFAWAQAERLQGNCTISGKLFSEYIANGANKTQSRAAFELMQDCIERNPVTTKPDNNATITPPAAVTPNTTGDTSETDDTSHTLSSAATDSTITDSTAPPDKYFWYTDTIGMSLVGSGAIGLIASGVLFQTALSIESDAENGDIDNFLRLKPMAQSRRNLSLGVGIAGGVLLSGGIVYYLMRNGSDKESSGLSVQLDSSTAGLSYSGPF